jgi:phasin family protein
LRGTRRDTPLVLDAKRVNSSGIFAGVKGIHMFDNFETIQKISKDNVDVAMKSFGVASKGMQAIATEVADFQKKSFEEGTAALEKLLGAKTLDKAFEVQTEFYKSAYEGFVSKATKIGELYADLAKESYKPIEGAVVKATAAAKQ